MEVGSGRRIFFSSAWRVRKGAIEKKSGESEGWGWS